MKIFEPEQIKYFNDYWDKHLNTEREKKHKQYHRLHNVIEVFPYSSDKIFSNNLKQLEELSGYKIRNSYMLQYQKGSYAELHTDKQSDLTWTTLLHTSDDLDGGEILLHKNNKIQIKKLKTGESCHYTNDLEHGVSEVMQGIRRVLIVWMKK